MLTLACLSLTYTRPVADGGLVSIIMPVHNSAETLGQAVRSVLTQEYQDWELLITDDGSSDSSWELVSQFAADDDRIKPERCKRAAGPAVARNRALERATGSWVAFLDSDDLWLPAKLVHQLAFARERDAPLSFCSYYKVAPDFRGEAVDFQPNGRIIHARERLTYGQMLVANYIGCLTAVYDRDVLGTRLLPNLTKRQDYALWLSILRDGHVAHGMHEPLALYREARPGSVSGDKLSLVRHNWHLYRRVERLGLLRSALALATSTARSLANSRV